MTASKMRVMQVVSNLEIGGAQEVVRTLAENLTALGCFSVVCAFKDGPLRAEIEKLGIPVEILPDRRHSVLSPFFIGEMAGLRRKLAGLVVKHKIDVIQTHLLRSLDFMVLSLRANAGPRVYWTFHNALFDLREDHLARHKWLLKPKRFSHHLLYRIGARYVDGLVAVSQDVKKAILETMPGMPANKISVILNSVDTRRYQDRSSRAVTRQALDVGETEHVMALVATFKRQKGHQFLLQAAAEVVPKFPGLRILLIGDGELREALRAQTAALHLEQNIRFLGMRSDVPQLLSASDSFILPSLWEGLPMALIEAMASGLPVIATQVSGTNQVVVAGETGWLVPPGDADALTEAMSELLSNLEQAARMGMTAQQRVEKLFSAQKQAQEYLTLFESAQNRASLQLIREDA
jgi:glycosyltransferase involved in cell wall biosynthesis